MNMSLCRIGLYAFALSLLVPAAGYSWHDAGHAAVAEIAWKDLAKPGDRKTRDRIVKLLHRHQDYPTHWKPDVEGSGVPEGDFLMMRAALWPDDIRPPFRPTDPKHPSSFFHMPLWHFKDRPYFPPGEPERKTEEPPDDAQRALARIRDTLTPDYRANTVSRGIALCWLVHLTGDVHQPLHGAAMISNVFKGGSDRGGNLFLIQHDQENLHSFWDGLFDSRRRESEWSGLAGEIMNEHPRTTLQGELGEPFRAGNWLDESHKLAVGHVYNFTNALGNKIALTPGVKDDPSRPPRPLPNGYEQNAVTVGRKRVALAGYRLADMLRELFSAD
jgi:hypothetical protein